MLQTEDISNDLAVISDQQEKLSIQKEIALKKALESDDVDAILKARRYIGAANNVRNLEKRSESSINTVLVDPNDLNNSLGYKNKSFNVSYDVLRAMARTPIIKSIITTRKSQISSFLQPQLDKYSTGFVVQPKTRYASHKQAKKLTRAQEEKIEFLIEFLLSCGTATNEWHGDSFDTFALKLVQDSLTFDQGTFEVGRDRQGNIIEFLAVDAGTMRIADSYDDDDYKKSETLIKGYAPSYVQVIDGQVVNEYHPWQLCFGLRNPSTDIQTNGYGRSELEDMIQTVTALLNADHYNANFFKVGSAPKGILKYSGDINMNTIDQFKNQWVAQTAGVMNMHKIPMINADKMDFVNLQQSNKDMEFSRFQEFLIKICCALYTIDPSEIGFPMSGSADAKPMFEGSNEARLKYSKDKGLKPLLKQIERWINKYIIKQLDPNYEFKFVGIDDETTYKEELENNIKKLQNFMTINEMRKEYNLDPIKGGDIVCNPIAFQKMMADQNAAQQMQGGGMEGGGQEQANPFDEMFGEEQQEDENPFKRPQGEDASNPFQKGLNEDIVKMLSQEITR